MACIVRSSGAEVTAEALEAHLGERFPSWWLPDRYEFVSEIPRTSTGKFDKMSLREQFDDVVLEEADD